MKIFAFAIIGLPLIALVYFLIKDSKRPISFTRIFGKLFCALAILFIVVVAIITINMESGGASGIPLALALIAFPYIIGASLLLGFAIDSFIAFCKAEKKPRGWIIFFSIIATIALFVAMVANFFYQMKIST